MTKLWLAILILFLVGCDSTNQPKKSGPSKESLAIFNQAPLEVREKLKHLNHIDTKYGDKAQYKESFIVSGETRSMVSRYKIELNELGYDVIWEGSEYVLRPMPKDSVALLRHAPFDVKLKLERLNRFEAEYRNLTRDKGGFLTLDEATAYINKLKGELNELGYDVTWEDPVYVLCSKPKDTTSLSGQVPVLVREKLKRLNRMEMMYGNKTQERKNEKVSDDTTSIIAIYKMELNELGYEAIWEDSEYVLRPMPQDSVTLYRLAPVEVKNTLRELNDWKSEKENKALTEKNDNGPDEDQAHINKLKRELNELGYDVTWEAPVYVLRPKTVNHETKNDSQP